MKKTRICNLLDIKFPILQGGMLWLADAGLAAAVSNAGGFGIISPYAGMKREGDPLENLVLQLDRMKELSTESFGVNIPLDLKQSGIFLDILIQKKVKVVVTAAGNPAHYTQLLQSEGMVVLHVVSSVKQAKNAKKCGVDAVIVEGVEAAGHIGFDEVPLFSLLPQVFDEVDIPIIAAGGIADSRGMVAAFSLGAEGIQMGTRFVSVEECIADQKYKEAIVCAKDTDTFVTSRKLVPTRSIKTEFSQILFEMERAGASRDDIRDFIGYRKSPLSQLEGKLDQGEIFGGTSSGLIKEIIPVSQVIREMVEGYEKIIKTL